MTSKFIKLDTCILAPTYVAVIGQGTSFSIPSIDNYNVHTFPLVSDAHDIYKNILELKKEKKFSLSIRKGVIKQLQDIEYDALKDVVEYHKLFLKGKNLLSTMILKDESSYRLIVNANTTDEDPSFQELISIRNRMYELSASRSHLSQYMRLFDDLKKEEQIALSASKETTIYL